MSDIELDWQREAAEEDAKDEALMAKVYSGECTLEEVQKKLAAIKRNAKKNGKITRTQAYTN